MLLRSMSTKYGPRAGAWNDANRHLKSGLFSFCDGVA